MPIEVIVVPPNHAVPRWWNDSRVFVRWEVQREPDSPVVTGVGVIMIETTVVEGAGAEDTDARFEVVGKIVIAKPALGDSDIVLEMDALTGDHEVLAAEVFDGGFYNEEFALWFDDTFGVSLAGDPVFILDLNIESEHQDEDGVVAAHAALDALATFGSIFSPLLTIHEDIVAEGVREQCRAQGHWGWVDGLRAERWGNVHVAVRPQD